MKTRKIVKKLSLILLMIIAIISSFLVSSFIYIQQIDYPVYYQQGFQDMDKVSYIVVPGAKIVGNQPGIHLQDRLDTAISLYSKDKGNKIIVSGGYEKLYALYESDVMEQYLLVHGVKETDIINDKYGLSTFATISRTKEFVKNKKVIICTQEMYLPRTMYLAEREGLHAVGASSDIHIYNQKLFTANIREFFASSKAIINGVFYRGHEHHIKEYPFDSEVKR